VNFAGGLSFAIEEHSTKLLTLIGSSFFDEPAYYGEVSSPAGGLEFGPERQATSLREVAAERIAQLSPRAQGVIQAALQVARSSHPRDLLAIAHWARREQNCRTTPSVLLAVAASHPGTKPFVRQYCPLIIARADEIRQVFAAYLHLFGRPLPNCLKRGLADAFQKFDEYALLRYDSDDRPTFGDVLRMIDRGEGRAVSKALREYFVRRQIVDATATPHLAAQKELAKQHAFDSPAQDLARRGRATWEILLSQFGNRREVWEFILREKLIGYMALLRNLRNLVRVEVSDDLIEAAAVRIETGAAESKQLPFRFVSAYRSLEHMRFGEPEDDDWPDGNSNGRPPAEFCPQVRRLLAAIDGAMRAACAGLSWIPGTTLIAADNSASMSQPVSKHSWISAADAANILCAMAARICERPIVWAFGTDVAPVSLDRHGSLMANANRVASANTRGCATNAFRIFQKLAREPFLPDRVILLSDMQVWNSDPWSQDRQLAPEFFRYRAGRNANVWLHSIDLVGYGDAVVPAGTQRVNLVSGFSEKILNTILEAEGGLEPGQAGALPSLQYIRGRF
jgi:hypothetical protein